MGDVSECIEGAGSFGRSITLWRAVVLVQGTPLLSSHYLVEHTPKNIVFSSRYENNIVTLTRAIEWRVYIRYATNLYRQSMLLNTTTRSPDTKDHTGLGA